MNSVNENLWKLPENYLFSEIVKRVNNYKQQNPEADVIKLGIGDVTLPLADAVIKAMHKAVDEMSKKESFRGYGPEEGYKFLREAVIENDYRKRGIQLEDYEVFITDGAKGDIGNVLDILGHDNIVAVTDPIYPVYVDSCVISGFSGDNYINGKWDKIIYLSCEEKNNFKPQLPESRPDIIYLCLPNNPTGTTLDKEELKQWVDYAIENKVLLLYDSAYEAYITENDVPHSIFEIEGAKSVAIEFRSFSKTAGFTGVRCGYTVVPKELTVTTKNNEVISLNKLWYRRQCIKYNGTSYIVQRAAEAAYSPEGQEQINAAIAYYMNNAKYIRTELNKAGFKTFGGVNAPYIWLKVPNGYTSWEFFDNLLENCHVVGTPGSGFGASGEGYFRLSAFGDKDKTKEAVQRIVGYYKMD